MVEDAVKRHTPNNIFAFETFVFVSAMSRYFANRVFSSERILSKLACNELICTLKANEKKKRVSSELNKWQDELKISKPATHAAFLTAESRK